MAKSDTVSTKENSNANILLDIWNGNCGYLPKARAASASRKRHMQARWKEHPDVHYWTEVVRRIRESDFCNGLNYNGWNATFDFFIKPDTHNKAMEGVYDNKRKKTLAEEFLSHD